MKLIKKKKGFTLIELMAVIAIIAILAAVLVPTVTGYINKSKNTAIISQVRSAVNAIETYNATAMDTIPGSVQVETEDSTEDDPKYEETSVTIKELVNGTSEKYAKVLSNAQLLSEKDVDRLGNMTVTEAFTINGSKDPVSLFDVDKNGHFEKMKASR